MDINKRSRAELKQYFVKNAIPTEKQFADLIDGLMSLKDDGITKLAGNPLCIEASGDDTSQKKILHLYNSFSDTDPTWMLSLNPRQDPSKPDTAKAGLNISDSAGNSRLFIDKTSGNIGVGTIAPTAKLEIVGDLRVSVGSIRFNYQDCQLINLWREVYGMGVQSNTTYFRSAVHFAFYADGKHDGRELNPGGGTVQMCIKDGNVGIRTADPQGRLDVRVPGVGGLDRFVVNTTTMWDGINPFVTIGAGGANGLMIANPHIPWNQTDSRASIRYGINLGTSSGGFWDVGVRNGLAFSFALDGNTDHKLWLDQDGSVKIAGSLAVARTIKGNRFTSDNTLVLNDYTTANPSSNVYLYSPPNDRDAWLYLDSADGTSNWGIYHRQIDAEVNGLPPNSIGFIGGGSKLQAFINLADGSAYHAGVVSVGGAWLKVRGAGNESAYLGGDSIGTDVQIGSENAKMTHLSAWNTATAKTMEFNCLKCNQLSDERQKEDIISLEGSLDKILRLRPVGFSWKDAPRINGRQRDIGLVAQEVLDIVPEAVSETRGLLSISYNSITALLVNAAQEQQRQIDELRTLVNKQVG